MKIKIERSGGIGGITRLIEVDGNKLTPLLENTVKKLLDSKESLMVKAKKPKGTADYFTYKITVNDGSKSRVIECNQFDLDDGTKSLIKYVENNQGANR